MVKYDLGNNLDLNIKNGFPSVASLFCTSLVEDYASPSLNNRAKSQVIKINNWRNTKYLFPFI